MNDWQRGNRQGYNGGMRPNSIEGIQGWNYGQQQRQAEEARRRQMEDQRRRQAEEQQRRQQENTRRQQEQARRFRESHQQPGQQSVPYPVNAQGSCAPRAPLPGVYDSYPWLRTLSNVLAVVLGLFGVFAGLAGGFHGDPLPAVEIVILTTITALLFAGVGKILPALVVWVLRLVVGLAYLALGLAVVGVVIVVLIAILRAL